MEQSLKQYELFSPDVFNLSFSTSLTSYSMVAGITDVSYTLTTDSMVAGDTVALYSSTTDTMVTRVTMTYSMVA